MLQGLHQFQDFLEMIFQPANEITIIDELDA
jgi:hypothetical protein